jgi:hypothetical protein
MRQSIRNAAILTAAMSLFAASLPAREPPGKGLPAVAPDPKAVALIQELAFPEAPTALREQKGWKAPRRIVLSASGPFNPTDAKVRGALQAVAPGVELVVVNGAEQMAKAAATSTHSCG